jgi:hypothetical protein
VNEASLEGGEADGRGADGVGDGCEGKAVVLAHGAQLGAGGQVVGRVGERLEDLAGNEALEAANDLPAGLALGGPAGDVGAGDGVVAHADQHDREQRLVGTPIATTVEPVAGGLAR